jgi:hypothetical protein
MVQQSGFTPRNAYDWTARLAAIAAAAQRIEAKSFTIDGEAVVLGADGLSRFDELNRREAAHRAMLYAFDLIEHDGQDLRDHRFLDRKAALARLLRNTEAGILLNDHVAEDGPTVFAHACRLGAEGIVSKRVDGSYRSGPCPVWIKVRNPPASLCSGSAARTGIGDSTDPRAGGFACLPTCRDRLSGVGSEPLKAREVSNLHGRDHDQQTDDIS